MDIIPIGCCASKISPTHAFINKYFRIVPWSRIISYTYTCSESVTVKIHRKISFSELFVVLIWREERERETKREKKIYYEVIEIFLINTALNHRWKSKKKRKTVHGDSVCRGPLTVVPCKFSHKIIYWVLVHT